MTTVTNFSEITHRPFLDSISSNPYKAELDKVIGDLDTTRASIRNHQGIIDSYEADIVSQKRQKMNAIDLETRLENKKAMLEKLASKAIGADLTKFNGADFDAKLKPLGMRFLAMDASQDYTYVYVVREAKPVSYIVAPPMIVRLIYAMSGSHGNVYKLHKAEVGFLVHFGDYGGHSHPHVQSGGGFFRGVCLGNFFDILSNSRVPTTVSHWYDHVIMLDQLLSTYNPASPYINIVYLCSRITSAIVVTDRDNLGSNATFSLVTSGLKFRMFNPHIENTTTFRAESILTKAMFDSFMSQIKNINLKTLLDDYLAELMTKFHDGDNVEMYEWCKKAEKRYAKAGIGLSQLEDYRQYDEDGDYYYLDEEVFDELKNIWVEEFKKVIQESDLKVTIPEYSPELYAQYFGDPETVTPVVVAPEPAIIEEAAEASASVPF